MKWPTKLGKLKPVPLASSATSLLLSGFFVTQGMAFLGDEPKLQEADDSRKPKPPASHVDAAPRLSTEQISINVLTRNIFDSTLTGMTWEERQTTGSIEDDGEEDEGDDEPDAFVLADCKSDLRLLASIITPNPKGTFAVIRRGAAASQQIPVGAPTEGVELLLLAPTHAYVRDGSGAPCRLPLYLSTTSPPTVNAAPAPAPEPEKAKGSKKPPLFNEADLAAGITELGPDKYKVSRSMITRGMADAAGVVRGTKFLPQNAEADDRNAGVKLQRVAETSTLYKLGMRDGDVLRALNGVNLSTPDGMLGAYALLREQKNVALSLMREGRPKTITYVFE